ncbi:MAG: 1-acyl-sn-glycerol-3-phosphate acyltransferase [Gammaproteobacteria bacterium]|nr:1-acyl-sn-glycerol-3-phosphate acyltransferase [Gammaproteobacteria bacterium]
MQDFDAIRPYLDHEVPAVVGHLVENPDLCHAAALFYFPQLTRWLPLAGNMLAGRVLRQLGDKLHTVNDVQMLLGGYMQKLMDKTIVDFTVTGLEALPIGSVNLFISTHRDIIMDSSVVNIAIHRAGHKTFRIAVGDNLLDKAYPADLMRLNKSFVVERKVVGKKALYRALRRTSDYIRASLEEGESVWIAQREGRSKDGFDRTDPAVVKMLALAHKKEVGNLGELCERIRIVPVAITYELDPCDIRKARELYITDLQGQYEKPEGEDLESMVEGMLGFKGRVHLHFGEPVKGLFDDADALAQAIDCSIVSGLKVYPTHLEAARRLGLHDLPDAEADRQDVDIAFGEHIRACPPVQKNFLFEQYANLIRNKRALGV